MAYTVKKYRAVGNDYQEYANGSLIGVEFTLGTQLMREICINFVTFDMANRIATDTFITQANINGSWFTIGSYQKTVSDFSGAVDVSQSSTFGNPVAISDAYELDTEGNKIPVSDPWLYQLKPNISTDAQFFTDTIIDNKYNIVISMSSFMVAVIVHKNSLTP